LFEKTDPNHNTKSPPPKRKILHHRNIPTAGPDSDPRKIGCCFRTGRPLSGEYDPQPGFAVGPFVREMPSQLPPNWELHQEKIMTFHSATGATSAT